MKTTSRIKLTLLMITLAGLSLVMTSFADGNPDSAKEVKKQKNENVLICHSPPGNPSAKQDLWVSPSAVGAHLAHGDFLGSCEGKPSSCKECAIHYQECLAAAGGDPKATALCEKAHEACLSNCEEGTPAPAPAPGSGGK
jgi:hypothetical protein